MSDVPDDVDLYKRALQQIMAGEFDAAVESLTAAIARNGDVAWYHHTLGDVLERQAKLAGAMQAYRKALQLNPVSSKYRQAMARVSAKQAGGQQAAATASTRAQRDRDKPRVLVVEDSEVARTWYDRTLRNDYQLTFATTARGALRALPVTRPALILLDWQLDESAAEPADDDTGLDLGDSASGLDVCKQIKRSIWRHVPVLMLTSKKGLINKTGARLARADRFLTKPVSAEVLHATIRELLAEAQQSAMQGQQA